MNTMRALDTATQRLSLSIVEEDPTYKDAVIIVICVKAGDQSFEMSTNCGPKDLIDVLEFASLVSGTAGEQMPNLS